MKEKTIVNNIIKYLESLPQCWCFKTHGGAYQVKGLPDIIGSYKGFFIGLEVKKPGEELTKLQGITINKIMATGGYAAHVSSVDHVKTLLKYIDKQTGENNG